MTTWRLLSSTWTLEPSILIGCAALLVCYLLSVRPLTARTALYVTGMLVLLLALISPIDTLGDGYLFSAHMAQHILLILVVPPLLLLGVPAETARAVLRWEPARRIEAVLGRPLLGWTLGSGTLWAWHAPLLYDAALRHEGVHVVQHLMFLISSTIFWWPILAPIPEARRLAPLATVFYLMSAGLISALLGIIITLAPGEIYSAYLAPVDRLGILPLVRGAWGLSPATDQKLGGLLMWVLGDPIYLLGIVGTLARWYNEEADEAAESVTIGEPRGVLQ